MNKENCALKLVDEIILYYDEVEKTSNLLGFVISSEHSQVILFFESYNVFIISRSHWQISAER